MECESRKHPQVKTFKNIDIESFKVIDESRAKDKRAEYSALNSQN